MGQERAQSAALAPIAEGVQAAVSQAPVVNMDETGWRQERQRAWLWTSVTAQLTVFLIHRSRGGAVVEALLGATFAGAVGSDRFDFLVAASEAALRGSPPPSLLPAPQAG